jgi:Mg-chelatase subunit ChlD
MSSNANIPEEFICPISQSIMVTPVTLSCGHTFDKSSLEKWLTTNETCPTCRTRVNHQELTTNFSLKSLIDKSTGRPASAQVEIFSNGVEDRQVSVDSLKKIEATFSRNDEYINLCLHMPQMNKRRAVSFVCIIDVSGSMGTEVGAAEGGKAFTRLDLVKHVLNVLIASLTDSDSLCLIKFSNESEVILDLVEMNKRNKTLAKSCVTGLVPEENTYTSPAIIKAFEVIKTASKKDIQSIILLTDGQDTAGEETVMRVFNQIEKPHGVQLNTFGFSNDILSTLLTNLAMKGGGIFGYIPDQSMIGTIFVNFLANTFITFAQDVLIEPNQSYKLNKHDKSRTVLQYGRTRHFLLKQVNSKANEKFSFKIGFYPDSMIGLHALEEKDDESFRIQKAKYKLLDLVQGAAPQSQPSCEIKEFQNSEDLKNVEEFLNEIKQSKIADPNNEQLKLALNYWSTWGAHYMR